MLNFRKRGRHGQLFIGVVAGALGASYALAGLPAGATVTNSTGNHVLIGSGSVTTYDMMQSMDILFNDSPGCTITVTYNAPPSPENFACQNSAKTLTRGNTENPTNDISVQESGLGSSTGIAQLENQGSGASTLKTAAVSYARSSRALKTTDPPGLNFVAYATDGVSWFHFTKTRGVPTPSSCISNLTQTQLTQIFGPTDAAEKYWTFYIPKGKKEGLGCGEVKNGKGVLVPAFVRVYSAQPGSGTLSTFDSYIGEKSEAYVASQGTRYNATHIIVENEDHSILVNGDEANAVFFFSFGKYALECIGKNILGCQPRTDTVQLGAINGIHATKKDILCFYNSTCTAKLPPFPLPRLLYNVYSNGSNRSFPAATPSTLNYVSEVGFICKPNTVAGRPITDINTGVSYRSEIASVIDEWGFFPVPFQKDEVTGPVPHPAASRLVRSVYGINDPAYHNAGTAPRQNQGTAGRAPAGYCIVSSTDG